MSHVDDVCEAIRLAFNDSTVSFEVGENTQARHGQRRRILFVRADGIVRPSSAPGRITATPGAPGTLARQVFERRERITVELRAESDDALDIMFDRFLKAAFNLFGPNILQEDNPYQWAGGDSSSGGSNTARQPAIMFDLWIRLKSRDAFPLPLTTIADYDVALRELNAIEHVASSNFLPSQVPQLQVWLRVDQAVSSGGLVSSIPDAMGGPSLVQASSPLQPTLGTTGNGLAKLTVNASVMTLAMGAALQGPRFGLTFWYKPANITTSSDFFNVVTGGGSSINRQSLRQAANDLFSLVWADASNVRSARTNRAILTAGLWKCISLEFDGAQVAELDRHRFKDMGTPLTVNDLPTFADSQGVVGAPGPASMRLGATGNALFFARTLAAGNPLQGEIGPNIFIHDPQISPDNLVRLASYQVPVG